jgi:hypothetical protein
MRLHIAFGNIFAVFLFPFKVAIKTYFSEIVVNILLQH